MNTRDADSSSEGIRDRWLARRRIATDAMEGWSRTQWIDWWSDGMAIWFSEAPTMDRELAFAPIRVNPEREELVDGIVSVLRRFLPTEKGAMAKGAASAFERQDNIESSLNEVMGRRFDVSSEERLLFLLRVAVALRAKRTAQIVRSAVAVYNNKWIEVSDSSALMSSIARAVFEGFTSDDLKPVRKDLEALLAGEKNFRTVLAYCLKAYRDRFDECIAAFYDLWRLGQGELMPDVWKAVALRLNDVFTEEFAAREIRRIRSQTTAGEWPTGFFAAEKLAHFYPASSPPGIMKIGMEEDTEEDEQAYASRNIAVGV